ncbi:CheY-like chemotaxis protein [Spirosoma lacussanchae]|uniref:response regulator n=1 Tax=Spirosoma lacussanchae TaxID=1884249 RepID=UPI00110902CE|nr:response regulator [Spirosoma lacussanchae]
MDTAHLIDKPIYTVDSLSSSQKPTPADGSDQPLAGIRLLLVDDYPINLKMAQRFMQKWGILVDTAENGQIAIDKFSAGTYDIVLMDLEMPVLDGYLATEAIRRLNPIVPVLALTGSAPFSNQDRAFAIGMNDYVTKPFNPDDLFEKIARYTQR